MYRDAQLFYFNKGSLRGGGTVKLKRLTAAEYSPISSIYFNSNVLIESNLSVNSRSFLHIALKGREGGERQ